MKLLVVSMNASFAGAVSQLAKTKLDIEEVVVSDHEHALERFLETEPTHVLVCEYEAGVSGGKFVVGKQTWADITASSLPGQRLVRTGLMECTEPDFIRAPFLAEDLRKILLE